ncbi:MAG: hypothetical protein KGH65_04795 [Candidatus Micrarchaeota archaeon]|nr:hypothetical protein [Candidatus Micrarchaeota archaeon]
MNKKIVIIGILLILAAFAAGIAVTPGTFGSIANTTLMNVSIGAQGSSSVPFIVGVNGLVSVIYNSDSSVDFYFANSTAFKTLGPYQNSSLLLSQWARNLYGNGVYEIIPNSANGIFPNFAPQNSTSLNYSYASQNEFPLAAGTYYAIFENSGNKSTVIQMISSISDSSRVAAGFSQFIKVGLVFFFALLAGIILIIYGILKKPKVQPAAPAADQRKVDEIYKDVDRKKPKGKK